MAENNPVIWFDGELRPSDKAQTHVLSHTLHYGSGAFEGIRAYQTHDGKIAIFHAEAHYERFIKSMRALGMESRYTVKDYIEATRQTIKANGMQEWYIRPFAYIDEAVKGLKLPDVPKPHQIIAVWPWGKYLGADSMAKGIRVMISTYRRPDPSSSLPWAKLSGNYLNSILARREASQNKLDEAILLDQQGFVAEGSGENIFVIRNGKLYTPSAQAILPGITRWSIMQIARDLGLEVHETLITRNELYFADEVFFTGTAAEVTPISEIDHRKIGAGEPGPITKKLSDEFFKIVKGQSRKYESWLTYV